jgi:hypothetical protein
LKEKKDKRFDTRISEATYNNFKKIMKYYKLNKTDMIEKLINEEAECIEMENDKELKQIIKGTYNLIKKERLSKMKKFKIKIVNCNISEDIILDSEEYKNMEDLLFSINMIIMETKTLSFEEDSDFYELRMLKEEITEKELKEIVENNTTITVAEKEDRDYCVYITLG